MPRTSTVRSRVARHRRTWPAVTAEPTRRPPPMGRRPAARDCDLRRSGAHPRRPAAMGRCMGQQIGMVGLGRMGRGMATRLGLAGHEVVVHDAVPAVTDDVASSGGFVAAPTYADLAAALTA